MVMLDILVWILLFWAVITEIKINWYNNCIIELEDKLLELGKLVTGIEHKVESIEDG